MSHTVLCPTDHAPVPAPHQTAAGAPQPRGADEADGTTSAAQERMVFIIQKIRCLVSAQSAS